MSVNGRLSSLRPGLPNGSWMPRRYGNVCVQQRRSFHEFIEVTVPKQPSSSPAGFRLAVKDNIATLPKDGRTTCASQALSHHDSPFEATIVKQLRARGAIVVGKTNLDEFGMGSHSTNSYFGPVSQPEPSGPSNSYSAGGSSGGSAVAVQTGAADVALGTDTGGSIRLPAAYCGVVGYKPSYGMLSRYGVVPYANSLDTVGLLSKTVGRIRDLLIEREGEDILEDEGKHEDEGKRKDEAKHEDEAKHDDEKKHEDENKHEDEGKHEDENKHANRLYMKHDPMDPTSLSTSTRLRCSKAREFYDESPQQGDKELLASLTFGIPVDYNIEELEKPVRAAWESAATLLQTRFGARVVPVSLPSTRHALSAYYVIAPAEASSNLAKYDGVRYGSHSRQPDHGVLYSATRGEGFGPEVKRRILLGAYTLSSRAMDNYFVQAQRVRRLVRRDFNRVFALPNPLLSDGEAGRQFSLADMDEGVVLENKRGPPQVDFVLCPTAPTLAPRLVDVLPPEKKKEVPGVELGPEPPAEMDSSLEAYMNDVFTVPASLAGLPAISLPFTVPATEGAVGPRSAGLQLIGQYWDDARLLAVADILSQQLNQES